MAINEQDVVERNSYGRDIVFIVDKIIETYPENIAILKGLTIRITADAPISDLSLVTKQKEDECLRSLDNRINNLANKIKKIKDSKKRNDGIRIEYNGSILHLEGDKRYTSKSVKYYKQLGLNAVVKHIPESEQAELIIGLLDRYKPDVLIITGHDAMIKKGRDYNDINNYRNSKCFVNAVRNARKWGRNSCDLVIFAGACQSYFEAIMRAGADFASSPGRILIDFIDPLIVAEKVATTDINKYVTITQIVEELKEGRAGIGGVGVRGKKRNVI